LSCLLALSLVFPCPFRLSSFSYHDLQLVISTRFFTAVVGCDFTFLARERNAAPMNTIGSQQGWRRLDSSLRTPGHPRWEEEEGYSPLVAEELRRIFALLRYDHERDFFRGDRERALHPYPQEHDTSLQAYERALACLNRSQSPHQRLQVYYALGLAYLHLGESKPAQETVDTALDLADHLSGLAATAELQYLAGSLACSRGDYKPGADYLSSTRALLIHLGEEDEPADTALMIDALTTHALCLYAMQAYPAAWAAVDRARLLVARPPGHPLRAGSLALLAGLLHRWTGDPARGLQEVMAGAEVFAEWGVTRHHRLYLARLQRVTAECALDLAEGSSARLTGFGRDAYLGIARPAIEQALVIAKETSDLSGEGMALLVQAREERLRGQQTDRLTIIHSVLDCAELLDDPALAILAQTARGQELTARSEREAALDAFQTADDISLQYQLPVLGVEGRRAVAEAREQE
jgi:tetratricopeptide (TPR) repeat protein